MKGKKERKKKAQANDVRRVAARFEIEWVLTPDRVEFKNNSRQPSPNKRGY